MVPQPDSHPPGRATLQPWESRQIPVKVTSTGTLTPGDSWHIKVGAYTLEPVPKPAYVRTDRTELLPRIVGGVDFGAIAVEDSSIKVAVRARDLVEVDGELDPPVAGAWVTIDYTDEKGNTTSRQVVTDANGHFRDTSMKPGTRTVRAFWQGTDKLAAATTEALAVPGSGVSPWTCLALATVAVLALVIAVSRRRRATEG